MVVNTAVGVQRVPLEDYRFEEKVRLFASALGIGTSTRKTVLQTVRGLLGARELLLKLRRARLGG
jgi:hypothetical protein